MGSVKKALDISGNRIGGCDERGVHGVDIAACYLGMTEQRCHRRFGEAGLFAMLAKLCRST